MQKIFEEYGGVVRSVIAVVALIGVVFLFFMGNGNGWIEGSFKSTTDQFVGTAGDAIGGIHVPQTKPGSGVLLLKGDGQTFYTPAPSTLTFRLSAPVSEFQEVKVNGETVDPTNYTLAENDTVVTLSIDYLKTLPKADYEITVVSASGSPSAGFSVVEPEKNEHGFYYNQPYTAYVSALASRVVFFVREDGTFDSISLDQGSNTETGTYTISGNSVVSTNSLGTLTSTISSDGTEIYCTQLATAFVLGDESCVADEDYIYVYDSSLSGYEVKRIDPSKTEYGAIRTGIYGYPTVKLAYRGFYKCTNLESITIPDSVTTIGYEAFWNCTSLTSVTFGENSQLTSIGGRAFKSCTSLTSITIPDSVTSIGQAAFYGCANLASVTFSENSQLTSIGDSAFSGCTGLTDITIPDGVTSIGQGAFRGCTGLTSVVVPDGVTSIGLNAFDDCTSLTNIVFEGTMAQWNDIIFANQWKYNVPATEVQCSDGTVSLS